MAVGDGPTATPCVAGRTGNCYIVVAPRDSIRARTGFVTQTSHHPKRIAAPFRWHSFRRRAATNTQAAPARRRAGIMARGRAL